MSSTKFPTRAPAPIRLSGRTWAKGPTWAPASTTHSAEQAVVENASVRAHLDVDEAREGSDHRPARTTVRPSMNTKGRRVAPASTVASGPMKVLAGSSMRTPGKARAGPVGPPATFAFLGLGSFRFTVAIVARSLGRPAGPPSGLGVDEGDEVRVFTYGIEVRIAARLSAAGRVGVDRRAQGLERPGGVAGPGLGSGQAVEHVLVLGMQLGRLLETP